MGPANCATEKGHFKMQNIVMYMIQIIETELWLTCYFCKL